MAITPGADGCLDAAVIPSQGDCCPPGLGEISYCAMACAFIGLLPSGPMWDRPKAEAMSFYQDQSAAGLCGASTCAPFESSEATSCYSLVQYSVYLSNILMDMLLNALWPALREADPFLAVTTLDDWLDRLGWEDCYRTACRSPMLGALTPYEIPGACGPIYCPVDLPDDLECAIKRALVHSLSRAAMGGIRTICWINWVIEPLGAMIEVTSPDEVCRNKQITLVQTSDTLPACPTDICPAAIDKPQGTVPARISTLNPDSCDFSLGLPNEIWPAGLSAACIVSSLLPNHLANNVRVTC